MVYKALTRNVKWMKDSFSNIGISIEEKPIAARNIYIAAHIYDTFKSATLVAFRNLKKVYL